MVNGSEGLEDCADEGGSRESQLETWAAVEYIKAEQSGDPKKYFLHSIEETIADFNVPHSMYHNVLGFVADRAGYHLAHGRSGPTLRNEVLHDSYQYLIELKNDFGPVSSNLPRYHRRWR